MGSGALGLWDRRSSWRGGDRLGSRLRRGRAQVRRSAQVPACWGRIARREPVTQVRQTAHRCRGCVVRRDGEM
eukprot:11689175-Alexandrium_andersonii.AAC.1